MLNRLSDWLDARTGYKAMIHEALDEPIPGGARWRYVFGSALTATFMIQLVTGLFLMASYSPSATTAWGSVWYISYVMEGGKWLRGIHHFGSQAMVILLVLHLLQVLWAGAYRAPREVNWWFGLALAGITLGFSLTGYLLPWDQKGYWATKVATNILGNTPGIGPQLQKVVVGGSEYGNQTLTRFYGLHVGLFPALLTLCLAAHVALFRKHGVTPSPRDTRGVVGRFWPEQVFLDVIASAAVLAILAGLTWWEGGANLDAPADPSSGTYPARPEWYFLSLFQLLKKFPGEQEYIGTFVIPTALMAVLLLLPLLDKVVPGRLAHFLACAFLFALLGGAGYLTAEAMMDDRRDVAFQEARVEADAARNRALQLAGAPEVGIPPQGAAALLANDPYTHGRSVLEQKCLSCHYYDRQGQVTRARMEVLPEDQSRSVTVPPALAGASPNVARAVVLKVPGFVPDGSGQVEPVRGRGGEIHAYKVRGKGPGGDSIVATVNTTGTRVETVTRSKQVAADLKNFGGSRGLDPKKSWIRGLLEEPGAAAYFGNVPQAGGMKRWKKGSKLTAEQLDEVAEFFVEHVMTIEAGTNPGAWEERDEVGNHPGYEHYMNECQTCHGEWGQGDAERKAPGLFGWGSPWWAARMIRDPADPGLYGWMAKKHRMPGFADQLTENDLGTLLRFLRGDYLPPAVGGASPPGATAGGPG